MNRRIFELAKQADLIQWHTLPSGAVTPDHNSVAAAKKFAELIIRECVQVAGDNAVSLTETPDPNIGMAKLEVVKAIIRHFGVE